MTEYYFMEQMYLNVFISSSFEGPLARFHVFTIVDSAAISIDLQVIFSYANFTVSLFPEVRSLVHRVDGFSVIFLLCILIAIAAALAFTPASSEVW